MLELGSENRYGISPDWLEESTGVIERRVSQPEDKPSTLAIKAARKALQELSTEQIDAIEMAIFCGIERDNPEPATAHRIQYALGIKANYTFDLSNACYGFIEAINIASRFIISRAIDSAIIFTGEIPSRVADFIVKKLKQGVDPSQFNLLVGGLTVGDAGGCVVLGAGPANDQLGFVAFNSKVDSRYVKHCNYSHTGNGEYEGRMDMARIVGRGLSLHKTMLPNTMQQLNWSTVDWLLTHQTGRASFERFSQLYSIDPSRMIKTYDLLGNITTATFPVCFDRLMKSGKVRLGDHIGGCFAGSGLAAGQFGYVVT